MYRLYPLRPKRGSTAARYRQVGEQRDVPQRRPMLRIPGKGHCLPARFADAERVSATMPSQSADSAPALAPLVRTNHLVKRYLRKSQPSHDIRAEG